jgi:long-chain acyl-CoA synthetase
METKPWHQQYDPQVPTSLTPYPNKTMMDVVDESASERPDHPALLFKGETVTYGELESASNAFGTALVAMGVEKGDRVALLLPNSPQFVIAQFGAYKAGAIVAPINPLYSERELELALKESTASTVVVLNPFYPTIKSLQERTTVQNIIATNIKEYLSPITRILFTLLKEKKDGYRIELQEGDHWFQDLLTAHRGSPRPQVDIQPSDRAILLFSGGTTGTPKAALGTHKTLLLTAMQIHRWFSGVLADWDDVCMLPIPLFHVYANVGAMGSVLCARGTLSLVPNPRDLDDLISTIRKVRPAFLPGVPTMFIALLAHPAVQAGKVDFQSMKLCISAAAPLLQETKSRFETLTGGKMVEAYGLTESMLAAVITPALGRYKPGAVGIPLPDVDMRIVDVDTGLETLAQGEVGEVLLKAPQLMEGYWERPTETKNTLREGWLYTGDLGYMDEDGYLFIVDRKKDLIKPSGFQVWPREVEEVIATHPAVGEVGVAGVPDAYQGEAVKAWVVLKEGQTLSEEELRDYCKENLAAYKVPRKIVFRESLPKTMVGKVLRRELVSSHEHET